MTLKFGYHLVKRVGRGRFSDVYEVEDPNTSQHYALKVCDPDEERPPHNIGNEIKILSKLKGSGNVSPLIKQLRTSIEVGILMPYYSVTLKDVMATHSKKRSQFNDDGSVTRIAKNEMPLESILHIFRGLLNGLRFIHSRGIIHRDINPNNVVFDGEEPVIIDFGISYDLPDNHGLEEPDAKFTDIATGFYKAPELLLSVRSYGPEVDVWALAIVLALLSSDNGRVPFAEDASRSDLALLSEILKVFGSPPSDWEDCQGSRSFEAMNEHFFKQQPKPVAEVLPRAVECPQLIEVFQGMTKYPSKERLTADQAYKSLLNM